MPRKIDQSSDVASAPSMDASIVEFENPPVAEVVCGIAFDQAPDFHSSHMGLFWVHIRDEFPITEVRTPILPPDGLKAVELVKFPEMIRHFYRSEDRSELVQLQQDRFLYNWLKTSKDAKYPRYKKIIRRFNQLRRKFNEFYQDLNMPPVMVKELRLEYVNHVPRGDGWETPGDINNIFPNHRFRKRGTKYLRPPTNWNFVSVHPVKDPNSRMNIALRNATRPKEGGEQEQVFLAQLSVIGKTENPSEREIQTWFNMAREAIDLTFVDITAPDVQKQIWKVK